MFNLKSELLLPAVLLVAASPFMAQSNPAQPTLGRTVEIQRTSEVCPTFRWEPMPNANGVELVVHEIKEGAGRRSDRTFSTQPSTTMPILRQVLPAGLLSWTPSTLNCLDTGRDYVWYVRPLDALGRAAGPWSAGSAIQVDEIGGVVDLPTLRQPDTERNVPASGGANAPVAGQSGGAGNGSNGNNGNGYGTGGIPAVLQHLENLQNQIQNHNDAVNARFDELEAQIMANQMQLDDIEERVRSHHQSTLPCTPERWRADRCAEQDSPLQVDSTFCFKMDLGAEMDAGYEIKPTVEVELGPGWDNVADVSGQAKLEFPALTPGPVPIPIPALQLELDAGIGGELEFCFSGLSFDGGAIEEGRAPDEFIELLVSSIESRRAEIVERAAMFAGDRNLTPDRLVDTLETLRELRTSNFGGTEPLAAFGDGPVRELITGMVDDTRIVELIDDPAVFVPTFDRSNPLAFCDTINSMPLLADKVGPVCNYVAEDMPDLVEVANTIDNLPLVVADQICESVPGLNCSADGLEDIRACRRDCRQTNRNCKNNCGIFAFSCRRSCEQTKNSCVDSCSN